MEKLCDINLVNPKRPEFHQNHRKIFEICTSQILPTPLQDTFASHLQHQSCSRFLLSEVHIIVGDIPGVQWSLLCFHCDFIQIARAFEPMDFVTDQTILTMSGDITHV